MAINFFTFEYFYLLPDVCVYIYIIYFWDMNSWYAFTLYWGFPVGYLASQIMLCLWKDLWFLGFKGIENGRVTWMHSITEDLLWNSFVLSQFVVAIGRWKHALEQLHFVYFYLNTTGQYDHWLMCCTDILSVVLWFFFLNYKVMTIECRKPVCYLTSDRLPVNAQFSRVLKYQNS